MEKWYLRDPHGLINDDYPFSQKYKEKLGTKQQVYALAVTQDEGMKPEVVEPALALILKEITPYLQNADIELAYEDGERKSIDRGKLEEELMRAVRDAKSPWYWDGMDAVIDQLGLKMLIQPESDGTEISIYLNGEKSEDLYNSLVRLFTNHSASSNNTK